MAAFLQFVYFATFASLGAASFCSNDINLRVLAAKEGDTPWQARGLVVKPGLPNSNGTALVEDNSWNVKVNVDQCIVGSENGSIVHISASVTKALPEPLPGYEVHPGIGYYKYHAEPVTWNEARKICIREGAHLVVPNSEEEAKEIGAIFKKHGKVKSSYPDGIFIGIHDLFEKGKFVTIFDEPLESSGYSKFSKGEPNNYLHKEDCANIFQDGTMNDIFCNHKLAFICEQKLY